MQMEYICKQFHKSKKNPEENKELSITQLIMLENKYSWKLIKQLIQNIIQFVDNNTHKPRQRISNNHDNSFSSKEHTNQDGRIAGLIQ